MEGVVDAQRALARRMGVVAGDFLRHVDQPAGVDGVVGCIQNAARL